jgi:hypothetical protein
VAASSGALGSGVRTAFSKACSAAVQAEITAPDELPDPVDERAEPPGPNPAGPLPIRMAPEREEMFEAQANTVTEHGSTTNATSHACQDQRAERRRVHCPIRIGRYELARCRATITARSVQSL